MHQSTQFNNLFSDFKENTHNLNISGPGEALIGRYEAVRDKVRARTAKEDPMTSKTLIYSSGDWIVHRHHGVGQIKGTEVMNIGGSKSEYYKVQTDDSTFWLPLEKLDADLLRPLSSPAEMQEALDVIGLSPQEMNANPTDRKIQISKIKPNNSPVAIAARVARQTYRSIRRRATGY